MNFLQIQYFLAVAEYKSFKKTAEALYVSQPAVSMHISQLESEWGFPLFFRKYKEALLTPAGKIMYDMLISANADYDQAIYEAKNISIKDKTELSIGIPEFTYFKDLYNVLHDFQNAHPSVVLNVETPPLSQLLLERNSRYDIVINMEYLLNNQSELNITPLLDCRHIFLISENHRFFSEKENISFSDLAQLKLYAPAPSPTSQSVDYCKYICACHGFAPSEVVTQPNVNSALLAAKMSFGFALLDETVLVPVEYNLKTIPTDVHISMVLAWHKNNPKPFVSDLAQTICKSIAADAK